MQAASELLSDLTEEQKQAVTHIDGPLLIVAGAGSGKTRVITRRVAYLIQQGVSPRSILSITFTNKAAGEMKSRISGLLEKPLRDFGKLDQPWPIICTFHSLCLRILRHYAAQIGLPTNFTIFDSADQTKLIKEAIKALELSTTNFPAAGVHGAISNAKNQLQTAADFARTVGDFYQRTVARIFTKYQQLLDQNNALDFDDLLLKTAHAFRSHPEVLKELQERFQYVLIDEYQDTNHAQYIIAHAMAHRHRNICVVGDPDQSIYAWRGADIKNILEFENDYPDAKIVRLEQNYRSTKIILDVASKLIANNKQRKDKRLWTENDQGQKVQLYLCEDERDEAQTVANRLAELQKKEDFAWSQMAVFYRMNALSRVMEDALRRSGIPYQMARGVEFYNRKEIKDVLGYLRVIANPSDELNLDRIINVPARGIGDSAVKLMQAHAVAHGISLGQAMEQCAEISGLTPRAVNSIRLFVQYLTSWRNSASSELPMGKGRIQSLLERVVRESGYEALLKKVGGEELEELANVNELITSAAEYDKENPEGTLDEYLSMISLVSDVDHMKGAGGAVTMMTLHAAKGLEFPVVAMIGLEEGVLPHARAREDRDQLEEERRLCFVGITRAQERVILSKANYRTIRGMRDRTVTSPFLNELPEDSLQVIDHTGMAGVRDQRREYREQFEDESSQLMEQFRKGQLVRHQMHGLGRILELSHAGQHVRAVIQFNTAGRKTIILQYTKLEIVG